MECVCTSVSPQATVKPKCGRVVGFSSGPVNPHGVTAVTAGRRCALALWFTKEKMHRDMVRFAAVYTNLKATSARKRPYNVAFPHSPTMPHIKRMRL